MRSEDLVFRGVEFKGKYSFQYIKNATFENCVGQAEAPEGAGMVIRKKE